MLGATPPRRTTRSSTRNDSDTLCSWSAIRDSANLPGKCIRWSVAIEPVTAIFMSALGVVNGGLPGEPTGTPSTPQAALRGGRTAWRGKRDSVEGVAAGAGVLRVGV